MSSVSDEMNLSGCIAGQCRTYSERLEGVCARLERAAVDVLVKLPKDAVPTCWCGGVYLPQLSLIMPGLMIVHECDQRVKLKCLLQDRAHLHGAVRALISTTELDQRFRTLLAQMHDDGRVVGFRRGFWTEAYSRGEEMLYELSALEGDSGDGMREKVEEVVFAEGGDEAVLLMVGGCAIWCTVLVIAALGVLLVTEGSHHLTSSTSEHASHLVDVASNVIVELSNLNLVFCLQHSLQQSLGLPRHFHWPSWLASTAEEECHC